MNKNQNTLVRFVYETIENPRKRSEFIATFAEVTGATAAAIIVEDRQQRWASLCGTHGMDQGTIDSYSQHYLALNPWSVLRPRTPGEVRRGRELLSEAELRDTEFYHGWYKPRGWLHSFSITLDATEAECTYMLALRPPNHPFTEEEMAVVKDLAPHLAKAAQIQKMVMDLQNPNRRFGVLEMSMLANLKLSPAESRLALALFKGQSVKEYAYKANMTAGTARWYVKNIYRKLGVHRQSDFMRLLLDLLRH